MTTITPDADGTLVLDGYGLAIRVNAGHLTWTPETWAALWPALRRVPQPRIRAALGCSKALSSLVVNGKKIPRPDSWVTLVTGDSGMTSCNGGTA